MSEPTCNAPPDAFARPVDAGAHDYLRPFVFRRGSGRSEHAKGGGTITALHSDPLLAERQYMIQCHSEFSLAAARMHVHCNHPVVTMSGLAAVEVWISFGDALQPDEMLITVYVPASESIGDMEALALERARSVARAYLAH